MREKPINFHAFNDRLATSGQPSKGQIHDIADEGYEVLINLVPPDADDAIPEEATLAASLDMMYINIPVPFDEPTPAHLKAFIGFMNTLEDRKVWVHCQVNARVSAFMYQYLTKVKGYSDEDATSPLMTKWRPKMDDIWQTFMEISNEEVGL